MGQDEVEAVLGHEISHVANGDMVTLGLIQGVVNTFVIFLSRVIGHVVDRVVFKTERGHGPAFLITTIIAQLLLGILASAIVMWFSRWREFRADAGGAQLAGREKMIAALQRLQMASGQAPLPDQLAAFGSLGRRWLRASSVCSCRIRRSRNVSPRCGRTRPSSGADARHQKTREQPRPAARVRVGHLVQGDFGVSPDLRLRQDLLFPRSRSVGDTRGGYPVAMGEGGLIAFSAGLSCASDIRRAVRKRYRCG